MADPSRGVVVYEFWIKENDEWEEEERERQPDEPLSYSERHIAARWRVVIVAANEILLDEYADELWSHGGHPYEEYRFDDTGEMYGIALVDHLAHPQIYLNRLLSALQWNAELVGNPVLLEPSNSGLERTAITNRPGQRLRLAGTAGMQNKPEWMVPPPMQPQVQQLVDFWISRIENISGFGGIKDMGGDRTSSDLASMIQEAAFVRVRSGLSNLESTLTRCAMKLADLVIENYTQPRIMSVIGPTGQQSALALRTRHFTVATEKGASPLKYSILVQAGASMPTSRQARMAMADKAYGLGIIDRQAWFEAYGYPNWPAVLQRVNEQIAVGAFNPPGARQRRTRS